MRYYRHVSESLTCALSCAKSLAPDNGPLTIASLTPSQSHFLQPTIPKAEPTAVSRLTLKS